MKYNLLYFLPSHFFTILSPVENENSNKKFFFVLVMYLEEEKLEKNTSP